MKLWIDDIRPAPAGWTHVHTVIMARHILLHDSYNPTVDGQTFHVTEISLDHDAGNFASYGGDYINLLDWLEEAEYKGQIIVDYTFHIHSQNSVGALNMHRIIKRNGWKEVYDEPT